MCEVLEDMHPNAALPQAYVFLKDLAIVFTSMLTTPFQFKPEPRFIFRSDSHTLGYETVMVVPSGDE